MIEFLFWLSRFFSTVWDIWSSQGSQETSCQPAWEARVVGTSWWWGRWMGTVLLINKGFPFCLGEDRGEGASLCWAQSFGVEWCNHIWLFLCVFLKSWNLNHEIRLKRRRIQGWFLFLPFSLAVWTLGRFLSLLRKDNSKDIQCVKVAVRAIYQAGLCDEKLVQQMTRTAKEMDCRRSLRLSWSTLLPGSSFTH